MKLSKAKIITAALFISAGAASAATNIIGDFTTTKGPDFVGPDSAVGNGDFQANAGALTYANVTNWHNLAGAETVNFQITNGTVGSPQSGSQGAQLSGTTFVANDTGYTIMAEGEVFSTLFYLGQFGAAANYGLDTSVTVHLFTSTTGVTGTTTIGETSDLGSVTFNPFNPAAGFFGMVNGDSFYTTTGADVGKTVYMGISMIDTDNNVFPRLDVVSLSVVPEPSAALLSGLGVLGLLRRRRA
ncbi:MAG: PEP-CTERM sorting domain-containing protein [Luteolibacter sp.]